MCLLSGHQSLGEAMLEGGPRNNNWEQYNRIEPPKPTSPAEELSDGNPRLESLKISPETGGVT